MLIESNFSPVSLRTGRSSNIKNICKTFTTKVQATLKKGFDSCMVDNISAVGELNRLNELKDVLMRLMFKKILFKLN